MVYDFSDSVDSHREFCSWGVSVETGASKVIEWCHDVFCVPEAAGQEFVSKHESRDGYGVDFVFLVSCN